MSKKRKSLATSLEEVDRTVYSTFCSGANSLSQLYSQAMNQQKLSFQAGERHGLEKLYQWILRQQEEGSRVAPIDIVTYLQADLDRHCEEAPLANNQHLQPTVQAPNTPLLTSSLDSSGGASQLDHNEHHRSKTDVFSNALSSPVRRSLQNYHIAQRNYYSNSLQNETGTHQDRHQVNSSDSSMDMHAESPGHDSSYRQL